MKTQMTKSKVLAICLLILTAASPAALADTKCKSIFAIEEDVFLTDGCTSPIGYCVGGTFRGNHGLRGTTFYRALSLEPIPNDSLGRLVAPGLLTFTTDDGAFTIDDVSVFDVARGAFAGVGRIVEGTGRYAGASGEIFTTGRVKADGVSFITYVTGDICLPQ